MNLTADQVLEGLQHAAELVDHYAPASVRASAAAAVEALAESKPAVDGIALLGNVGLARAQSYWEAVSPFGAVPVPATSGDQALARLYGRGRAAMHQRDDEIAAFSAITNALLTVGWEGAKAALPYVIAAVRG